MRDDVVGSRSRSSLGLIASGVTYILERYVEKLSVWRSVLDDAMLRIYVGEARFFIVVDD